jgi:protein-disulfide isomerase
VRHASSIVLALLVACAGPGRDTRSPADAEADQRLAQLEARVHALEARETERQDLFEWLRPIKDQAAREAEAEANRPRPDLDAIYAVPVGQSASEGPADAPVTVVLFFDFACPYCRRVEDSLTAVRASLPRDVRVVYKHFVVHPVARDAHLAVCAAGLQGKFAAYRDLLWTKVFDPYVASGGQDTTGYAEANLVKLATGLKLDRKRFLADLRGPACAATLSGDQEAVTRFGIEGTPALYVNGQFYEGAIPETQLREAIGHAMDEVAASKVAPGKYYEQVVMQGEPAFKAAPRK